MPDRSLDELARQVSVAQSLLDRVIHTTDNLDEKVGRIFTSMSFLMVGTTILFTSFLSNNILLKVYGVSVISLLFLGFVISVALATTYMLRAMGPRFHFSPFVSSSKTDEPPIPSPTGYADKISNMKEGEWTDFFRTVALYELYQRLYSETVEETYLLSSKVKQKATQMKKAQRAFLYAIVLLILMLLCAVVSLA